MNVIGSTRQALAPTALTRVAATRPTEKTVAVQTAPSEACELTSSTTYTEARIAEQRVDPLAYWNANKAADDPVLKANAEELEGGWKSRLEPGEAKCVVGIQVDPAWLKKNESTGKTFVYLEELADAVLSSGGVPKLIFPGRGELDQQREGIGCLLNSGGSDIDPSFWGEAPLEGTNKTLNAFRLANTKWALDNDVPFLGLCLGSQEMAVADGGKLSKISSLPGEGKRLQHWDDESAKNRTLRHRENHSVTATPDSLVGRVLGPLANVNSIHNWAVSGACPGPTMLITAWGMEEHSTPEAIQKKGNAQQNGVQFHPEFMRWTNSQHDKFFEQLVNDGSRYAQVKGLPSPTASQYPAVAQDQGFFILA